MNIVLLEPEIPHNAGAIGRTCHATGAALHLIRPLGFDTSDKAIKRAGLDYWRNVDVRYYDDYNEFLEKNKDGAAQMYFASTKAEKSYADTSYSGNVFFIFGKESKGLPEELLAENRERCIRIPMLDEMRSLNLSVSVGIILYEALRQNGYNGLKKKGQLHHLNWNN